MISPILLYIKNPELNDISYPTLYKEPGAKWYLLSYSIAGDCLQEFIRKGTNEKKELFRTVKISVFCSDIEKNNNMEICFG